MRHRVILVIVVMRVGALCTSQGLQGNTTWDSPKRALPSVVQGGGPALPDENSKMIALRDAFAAAGSVPSSWSGGVSGDSCQWPGVECSGGHVTKLDLSNNQLASLPAEIGTLTSLTILNLSNNQLASLPPEIGGLTSLTTLYLSNNQLTSLPAEIGELPLRVRMWVNNNRLTSLPPEIGSLTLLSELDLNNNRLTNLPAEIGSLTSLTKLGLSNNRLRSLPGTIWTLPSLAALDIRYNVQLCAYAPETFEGVVQDSGCCTGEIPKVTALRDAFQAAGSLPSSWEGVADDPCEWPGVKCSGERVTKLDLSHTQLTSLPPEIGTLTSLTILWLNNNRLTSLPPEIGSLTLLQYLYLSNNQLANLPSEIGSLPSLQGLDVSSNHLLSFLAGDGGVLAWLDISNNFLSSCSFTANMASLVTLDISDNPLLSNQTLPEMQHLQFLTAHNCFHDDLSSLELERSPNLSIVDLSDSPGLTGALPDALGQLTNLRVLRLRNTSLASVEDPVCESANPRPCVPAFLDPGPLVTRTRNRHFSCYEPQPPPHSAQSSLLIEIDWDAYFRNQLCRCHTGYVGRLGTCHACPENSECPGDDDQTVMIPTHGYWAPVGGNMSSELDDLTLDGVCPASSFSSWLSICPLVSRSVCSPESEDEFHPCAPGYTGRMCTGCLDKYTRWGSRCYACPTSGVTWTLYGIGAVCIMLIGIALWLWVREGVSALKTLLFFAQVLALLPSLGVSAPGSVAGISEVSSFSSLAIPGLSCLWEGYDELTSFWFKWALFGVVMILVCCVNGFRAKKHPGAITAGLVFLIALFYLPLSSLVLRYLRCEWDPCLGESFFASMPHLPCKTDRAVAVRVMAWILVPGFVLGVLVCLGWILWWIRSRGRLEDPAVQARLGQLYLCYTEERWWWEVVATLRRLLIAASVSLAPMESGLAPPALFLFLLVSTELQRTQMPYRSKLANRLEYWTLVVLGGNVMGESSLDMSEEAWARQVISAVLVAVDALWFFVLFGASMSKMALRLREKVGDIELYVPFEKK